MSEHKEDDPRVPAVGTLQRIDRRLGAIEKQLAELSTSHRESSRSSREVTRQHRKWLIEHERTLRGERGKNGLVGRITSLERGRAKVWAVVGSMGTALLALLGELVRGAFFGGGE